MPAMSLFYVRKPDTDLLQHDVINGGPDALNPYHAKQGYAESSAIKLFDLVTVRGRRLGPLEQ